MIQLPDTKPGYVDSLRGVGIGQPCFEVFYTMKIGFWRILDICARQPIQ